MNNVEKYYWIIDHQLGKDIFGQNSIELTPHMVNPLNDTIEDDRKLNTKQQWWVEVTSSHLDVAEGEYIHEHLWSLDTGGDTAEEAVDKLYELVLGKFGVYEEEG